MPLQQTVKIIDEDRHKTKQAPKIIKWKGVQMARNHSFMATIHEIVNFSAELDVCRVGLVGDMHSGKSTLSQAIAHAIHTTAKIPYAIKVLYKPDLLDFKGTLAKLEPVNQILIFDDVSFMGAEANRKQIESVKSAISTIRHLDGGKDVKIIVLMNYHYSLGLDKYLRTADFKYITTVGSSENENMEKMFGTKYHKKITDFKKYRQKAVTQHRCVMRITKTQQIKYEYRKPFIPVLFWNEQSLRFIVSPTRQFMSPICSKCTEGEGMLTSSQVSIEKFVEESEHKFGSSTFLAATKLTLFTEGKNVYSKSVVAAYKYLNRCRESKMISLEQMAEHYKLSITNTKLRKQMDGVMSAD